MQGILADLRTFWRVFILEPRETLESSCDSKQKDAAMFILMLIGVWLDFADLIKSRGDKIDKIIAGRGDNSELSQLTVA